MPYKKEDDDDLFEDDFEFVDDEDSELEDDSEVDESEEEAEEEETKPVKKGRSGGRKPAAPKAEKTPRKRAKKAEVVEDESPVETEDEEAAEEETEAVPTGPPADYAVHVYEFRKFKRTIQRDFTSDEADGFAKEYNRTSSNHSRWAVAGGKEDKPTPTI